MATQRDRFRSYNYEDGGMSLDDLLMQIEQPQIQQPQIQQAAAPVQNEYNDRHWDAVARVRFCFGAEGV